MSERAAATEESMTLRDILRRNLDGYSLQECFCAELPGGIISRRYARVTGDARAIACISREHMEAVLKRLPRRKYDMRSGVFLVSRDGNAAFNTALMTAAGVDSPDFSLQAWRLLRGQELSMLLGIDGSFEWAPA